MIFPWWHTERHFLDIDWFWPIFDLRKTKVHKLVTLWVWEIIRCEKVLQKVLYQVQNSFSPGVPNIGASGKIILTPAVYTWVYLLPKFHEIISQIDRATAPWRSSPSMSPKLPLPPTGGRLISQIFLYSAFYHVPYECSLRQPVENYHTSNF